MAKIEGIKAVIAALRRKGQQAQKNDGLSVVVGYTQSYAVYVHENRNAYHPIGKAGFLLDPARRLRAELARIVRVSLQRGRTAAQALLLAGLRLQRESQQEVPVDTGALRASAFTRLEKI